MAQIEAYIYILDFQVIKMYLYKKVAPKMGQNWLKTSKYWPNWQKIGYFFNFEGQNGGLKFVQLTWEWF